MSLDLHREEGGEPNINSLSFLFVALVQKGKWREKREGEEKERFLTSLLLRPGRFFHRVGKRGRKEGKRRRREKRGKKKDFEKGEAIR